MLYGTLLTVLMAAAPAIALAAGTITSGTDAVVVVMLLSAIGKVVGGLLLVIALAAGILTQSMSRMLLAFPAVVLFNTGELLSSLGGIELPTEDVETPLITPIVKEWVVANYWSLLLVLLGIAAAIWLTAKILGVRLRRAHQPAVAYWKVRLLDALSDGERFIEDEALRLALAGATPDTDPIIARQILREMTRLVEQADLYDYGGPTSLRGRGCIHRKLRGLMRDDRCGGFVTRALTPLCNVLESMPRTLGDALDAAAQERNYDDLLRLKLPTIAG